MYSGGILGIKSKNPFCLARKQCRYERRYKKITLYSYVELLSFIGYDRSNVYVRLL